MLKPCNDLSENAMSLNEIRRAGIQLLTQKLGAVGMVRFLQQSETGWGDYAEEREQWLGNHRLSDIAAGIKNMKRPDKES